MTTNGVEGQPMIVSTQADTLGSENDSQVPPERVFVVTHWLGAYTGRSLDRIVLPREPVTEEDRLWVESELRTRLNPGGKIEIADENGSQLLDITVAEYQAVMAKTMPEKALLNQVRALATALGFLIYHTHRSDRSEPGFPDLTLVKAGRLIFAELKTQKGKTTQPQDAWLMRLEASTAEVYLWRPIDLLNGSIEATLRRPW
jgi:hypothetical protein